ncbi:MAG: hypothetical protein JXA54_14290 [Candidatus Heimdallarchaeota archaeon]|nr:hypothetical protein [Candidatus Heimdallarchaeota archaeon]
MTYSISYLVTEKYDPTRKELGLKVSITGFDKYKGQRVRFSGYPSTDKVFSKTGALTFTLIGTPGNNIIEVMDIKTNRVIQQIGSLNGNILLEGDKGQEIIISHKSKVAAIVIKKVQRLKDELIRLEASPKIPIFFGIDPDTNQNLYTKKTDKKGSFDNEITGAISEKHEIRILTGQMNKICSIKPPEP